MLRTAIDRTKPFNFAVGDDRTEFVVAGGSLIATASDDRRLWRFHPRDYLGSSVTIDVNGDVLVAGRRRLFAVRPDGAVRWRVEMPVAQDVPMSVLVVRPEGVYVRGDSSFFIPRSAQRATP